MEYARVVPGIGQVQEGLGRSAYWRRTCVLDTDIAAATLVDVHNSREPVFHIEHPKPVPFISILRLLAKSLDVLLIPRVDWLSRLEEKSEETNAVLNAAKENLVVVLLEIFRGWTDRETEEVLGMPALGLARVVSNPDSHRTPSQFGSLPVRVWDPSNQITGALRFRRG